jgi:hypothetical protein
VSQKIEDKVDAAEARTHETKGFMQQVRVVARRWPARVIPSCGNLTKGFLNSLAAWCRPTVPACIMAIKTGYWPV